jgi:hypothetical protein
MGLGAKMTDQERAVMQQALEALEIVLNNDYNLPYEKIVASVTAIRAALAEPLTEEYRPKSWGELEQQYQAGCDHCTHPQYVGIRCNVCGRWTEVSK